MIVLLDITKIISEYECEEKPDLGKINLSDGIKLSKEINSKLIVILVILNRNTMKYSTLLKVILRNKKRRFKTYI